MKRDLYIDFCQRFGYSFHYFYSYCFLSGQLYLPSEVRTLSLLIDVPVFFVLSGLTFGNNVEKLLYRLLKLQVTYDFRDVLVFFLGWIYETRNLQYFGAEGMQSYYTVFGTKYGVPNLDSTFNWDMLGNWVAYGYSNCDSFPRMGSFGILKSYIMKNSFGVLVLKFFPKNISNG